MDRQARGTAQTSNPQADGVRVYASAPPYRDTLNPILVRAESAPTTATVT